MGMLDNNIHMNGAGTTYQAFLDLADAAEEACNGKGARGNYLGLFAGTLLLSTFVLFSVRAALAEPPDDPSLASGPDAGGETVAGNFISV